MNDMDTNQNKSKNSGRITSAPCDNPTHRGHEVFEFGVVRCRDCVAEEDQVWLDFFRQRERERERLGVDDSLPFVATDHAWTRREMESSYRAIVLFVLIGLAALAALGVMR